MPSLGDQVQYVRGVGPRVAEMLAEKGILTAEDLLYHFPFRYEDRQNPVSLEELKPGDVATRLSASGSTRRISAANSWPDKRSRSTAKSSRRARPATSR